MRPPALRRLGHCFRGHVHTLQEEPNVGVPDSLVDTFGLMPAFSAPVAQPSNAGRPVMARPMINVWISSVPS